MRDCFALSTIVCVALMMLVACSSSGSGSVPKPPERAPLLSVQELWSEQELSQATAENEGFAQAVQALWSQGYSNFLVAGRLGTDDGIEVRFAAYASQEGTGRTAVEQCENNGCTVGIAWLDGGDVRIMDLAGKQIEPVKLPLPPLLREYVSQDESKGTTLVSSPLEESALPMEVSLDLGRRRVLVLSQFGPHTGFSAQSLLSGLDLSGFDQTFVQYYVGTDELLHALASSYQHEVLVYVGQAVRKLLKDAKDPAQRWFTTKSYMVSKGIYGFEPVGVDVIRQVLANKAPLGGPGVVLLVASESIGDMSPATEDPKFETPFSLLSTPGNVVAGFVGSASPQVILEAAHSFLSRLLGGATAGEALEHANSALDAWGEGARMVLTKDSDANFRLPPKGLAVFGGRTPKGGSLNLFFLLRPWCANAPGQYEPLLERQANPWFQEIQFQGPVFEAERSLEVAPEDYLQSQVKGVLGELREGAHFFFVFTGGLTKDFRDVTLYCNAEITSVEEAEGKIKLTFTGAARSLPFKSQDGQECILKYTLLEPLIHGQAQSTMEIEL